MFAGDVRDLRLLRLLHADVELHRAAPLTPAVQLLARVERLALQERELCLAPSYFETVAARHPGWTVRVESKGERARTEMSRFRYDVTILGPESRLARGAAAGEAAVRWRALGDGALETLSAMAGVLAEGSLVVTDVPNARLSRPRAALLALTEAPPNATAWDVARSVWDSETDEAADPADVVAQGRERGLDIRVEPARSGRETCVDVVFRRPCRAT